MDFRSNRHWTCCLLVSGMAAIAPVSNVTAQDLKLPFGAFASSGARTSADVIAMFDTDNDARISRTEARVKIISAFSILDGDRNNVLSPQELPNVTSADYAAADNNRDGGISAMEFLEADFATFSRLDSDSDGYITASELAARMTP